MYEGRPHPGHPAGRPAGAGPGLAPVTAPPPREAWRRPVRFEPVPGSPYRLAIVGAPAVVAGPAVGSLVAGVAAVLVALVVGCLGLRGANAGWGLWAGSAFAVLATCLGLAGIGLGVVGIRQTRRPAGRWVEGVRSGRGMAVAGLICGAVGLVITVCTLGAVATIQLG